MTFRTTANLEGKSIQGQQPAGESGNKPKGGTLVSCKFSVHGETEHVEPKFPRDDNHIRHSLLTVATPTYHIPLDDMGKLSVGGRQTMSLKKGTNGHLHTVNVLYVQKRDRLHAERRMATEPS